MDQEGMKKDHIPGVAGKLERLLACRARVRLAVGVQMIDGQGPMRLPEELRDPAMRSSRTTVPPPPG